MARAALTPARKKALGVLLAAEGRHTVRISNQTTDATVYWQSADWLIKNGLAELVAFEYLELTDAGRDISKAVT